MTTTIALSDPDIGRDYYILSLTKSPTDLDEATDLLETRPRHAWYDLKPPHQDH